MGLRSTAAGIIRAAITTGSVVSAVHVTSPTQVANTTISQYGSTSQQAASQTRSQSFSEALGFGKPGTSQPK